MSQTKPKHGGSGGFQVAPGMFVRFSCQVFDADGELVSFGEGQADSEIVFGFAPLLSGVERALEGRVAGERRSVTLAPQHAYGQRDERAILEVDRDEFPEDVAPGDRFEVLDRQGRTLVLRVLEVDEERVVVDGNHPLSGQSVRFEISVSEVRPATEAELRRAEARIEEADASPGGFETLVSPERLLQGPSRRYEQDARPGAPQRRSRSERGGSPDMEESDD